MTDCNTAATVRRWTVLLTLLIITSPCASETNPSVSLHTGIALPIMQPLVQTGIATRLAVSWPMRWHDQIHAGVSIGAHVHQTGSLAPLAIFPIGIGVSTSLGITDRISLIGELTAGGYAAVLGKGPLNINPVSGFGGQTTISGGISHQIWTSIAATGRVGMVFASGFTPSVDIGIGVSYTPNASPMLTVEVSEMAPIYPAMSATYVDSPPARITIHNSGYRDVLIRAVTLDFADYMPMPVQLLVDTPIKAGDSLVVPATFALGKRIMGIVQSTSVAYTLSVTYEHRGRSRTLERSSIADVRSRNAMVWDNDAKAASFITEKDQALLNFVGQTASTVESSTYLPGTRIFRLLVGLVSALDSYGIRYAPDPVSPYSDAYKGLSEDFVKFPREMLAQKIGDCDDLSVLLCALGESVGIPTAFITTPGHVFPAFGLQLSRKDALKLFGSLDDLILTPDDVWLPVETTLLQKGFMVCWRSAASQWRDAQASAQANFVRTRVAWKTFPPAAAAFDGPIPHAFPSEQTKNAYEANMVRFIDEQIHGRERAMLRRIENSDRNPRHVNNLAVFYVRLGKLKAAEQLLTELLQSGEDFGTLINMGNIYLLTNRAAMAIDLYARALSIHPQSTAALLGLGKAEYALGNYSKAAQAFRILMESDPEKASKVAYLSSGGRREADFVEITEGVEWYDP